MSYKTISARCEARFIEKKSEFIGYLCPVSTEDEAISFINEIRSMHRKATHNCYAYILRENNTARHSDDGEPSGTAGVPIFDALQKSGVTDVACVVTRYFGGILLGAGGLVRAYSKGASVALDAADIVERFMACKLEIRVDYSLYQTANKTLLDFEVVVLGSDFGSDVNMTIYVKEEQTEKLTEKLIDNCNGKIYIKNILKEYADF